MRVIPAIVICLMPVAPQTLAQDISAADPASIVAALQTWGAAATLDTTDDGAPVIDSKIGGINCPIYFYGCDDATANCESITFEAVFTLQAGSPSNRRTPGTATTGSRATAGARTARPCWCMT